MIELFKLLADPVVLVLTLMILGLALITRLPKKRRYRIGRWALFLGVFLLFLLSIKPVSNLLVYCLECQYEQPSEEVLSTLDVVAILGGGMNPSGGFRQSPEAAKFTYARLFSGVRIFRQTGARTLALCGGGWPGGKDSEANVMEMLAIELGVEQGKIITETDSRNTMENAAGLARLLPPAKGRQIGLVTSALHMPRARKVFEKQFPNDTIVPVPVAYVYSPDWLSFDGLIPSAGTLSDSDYAIHEWIGMLWYAIQY